MSNYRFFSQQLERKENMITTSFAGSVPGIYLKPAHVCFLISTSRCVEFGDWTLWVLSRQHNLLTQPFTWDSRHSK